MAFVFETERDRIFEPKKATQNIGPGQYLPLSEFKFKNPEIVPFGVATRRKDPGKLDKYPGPGTYYHDVDKEKNEKILKNSVKNYISKEGQITISSNGVPIFEPERGEQEKALNRAKDDYELLGFSSKVKRFASLRGLSTPGPGTYDDEDIKEAKSLKKKCIKDKKSVFKINNDRQNVYKVNKDQVFALNYNKNETSENEKNGKNEKKYKKSKQTKKMNKKKEIQERLEKEQKEIINNNEYKYRVSSIPSKNNKGYIKEESTGLYARKKNPDAYKIFSGDKDDAVGPGSYELIFPEDWKKRGTYWSKSKWEKDPKKIRPKSSYNINSIYCEIGNFRKKSKKENSKVNKEMSNYYKSYTTKQLNYKDPTAHNIDTITEVIKKRKMPSFIPVNNVPGPGFYYDSEIMDGMRKASSKPIAQKRPYNFEEELLNELFNNMNNNEEGEVYDIKKEQAENFKKKILEKINKKDIPFLCKSERFNYEPYKSVPEDNKKIKNSNKSAKNKNRMKGIKVQNHKNTDSENISKELSNYSSTNNSSTNNIIYLYSRPQSMSGTFFRKGNRFREREIEENVKSKIPGPGSYINPFTCTGKTNSIQMNGRYMDIRTCVKYIENNRFNNLRPKTASYTAQFNNYINYNKNPGVGSYEPESVYTVKHDVANKMKQGNRTFNSTKLSDRNAIYQFQKNDPNGPGSYFQNNNKSVNQNYNAFNQTSLRFEKGGKNNTKEVIDDIFDNRIPLNAMISTFIPKDDNEINYRSILDKTDFNSQYKARKKTNKKNNSYIGKISKKSNIGPGTYEYSNDRFPWVKPSFNVKYN